MKRISIVAISLFVAISVLAQKNDSTAGKLTHEFGFHAGTTTAVGLSYRYWPGKLGVQLTALPIKTSDMTFVSMGLTALYSFYNTNYFRFFGYLANNVTINNYTKDEYVDDYYNYANYKIEEKKVEKTTYNVGFGPGFGFGSKVRFNIMAGYGFYDILGEFNMLPTGEIGLYFRL